MTNRVLSGLFINCVEAKDSIFESGKMAYGCLLGSGKFSLEYLEITPQNAAIPTNFDFYLFNYHHITMSWLDTKSIRKALPGVKMTLVLEVSPNDPFVFCPNNDFDAYCVLDPTLNLQQKHVYAFPRPLEKFNGQIDYQEQEIPIIGSFGFATTGKGFEHVIDAVNKEFGKAVVRINIPYADYTDGQGKYAKALGQMCCERAKGGIDVRITHDFMDKPTLIKWCGQNTLNCFLYDRNQPGLAATTDQAITSGRPLITSKNNTFRHIQSFIKPFPYQSLKDAIANTAPLVAQIQKEWSPQRFCERFEKVLESFDFVNKPKTLGTVRMNVFPPPKIGFVQRIKDKVAVRTRLKNFKNHRTLRLNSGAKPPPIGSYSQFGEDVIINNFFKEIPIKTMSYLDIGANNPKYISNTFSFYEQGFSGVLVEPNPRLCAKLREIRPRDKVLSVGIGIDENVDEADFYMFGEEADGLSTFSLDEANHWENVGLNNQKYQIQEIWKAPLLNINRVIEDYFTECPDLISMDVEGWDLKILKTLDFEKYSPAVFCVETLAYKEDGSTYRIKEIYEFFESKGYFSFAETYANNIFVNKNLYDFYQYQKAQRKS